ncbi:MAG: phenylacetate--CoA ligase family protein [Desulfobacteraceae bacterium]|nr:MAG: phenylacetate--CoA ligase family protein [Desulfobacteraceae bacterium]
MNAWLAKNLFYPLWDLKDGRHKLKALRKLENSQWHSAAELKEAQWAKLKTMVQEAYNHSAYYRRLFDQQKIRPADIRSYRDFLNIPLLTKKQIQLNPEDLISQKYAKENLASAKTGGSTGKALQIFLDEDCVTQRIAAAMRSDRWAGWDLGMKRAAIWGNPPVADTWKKKIRRALLDPVIYLDTMNLNRESLAAFASRFQSFGVSVIFGHAHSVFIFAKFVAENKIGGLQPRGVICSSMMLLPRERTFMEKTFHCKVTNRYGCEEVGLIACECEKHEGLHLNVDHLYIEFLKSDGTPAEAGEQGAIVVTDLENRGMPLIRYQIEDFGVPSARSCSCGRGLPLMEQVVGRTADFLKTEQGALVAGVSLIERTLTAIKGIEQMQIVQDAVNRFRLNIVPQPIYSEASEAQLIVEMKNVFGSNSQIQIHKIGNIPQERSGKYRFAISHVL